MVSVLSGDISLRTCGVVEVGSQHLAGVEKSTGWWYSQGDGICGVVVDRNTFSHLQTSDPPYVLCN